MYCSRCGTQNKDTAKFCDSCGLDLTATTPTGVRAEAPDITEIDMVRQELSEEYEIVEELGRGGMAIVFKAKEKQLDREVAIKVLPFSLAFDKEFVERFQREARTSARLEHPNIIPIYRVGKAGRIIYFVMKFLRGKPLSTVLTARGSLPPAEIKKILAEVGRALAYAHKKEIVHRDIKPDNIMFDEHGHAVVTDFGIAKAASGGKLTGTGMSIGTPHYMSPEQAKAQPLDGRSDLYSLGVVAFYVLSGQLPFNAVTDAEFLVQHIAEPAPSLATVVPLVPPRVAQIVDRCLSKEAWARFADAASLVRALADAVEPPPVPLAVRAFLVRSAHLDGPALIHGFITGAMLLPATIAAWLSATTMTVRGLATAALVAALIVPVGVAVSRARRLLLAGQNRGELVAALAARQARRREELVFAYGPRAVGLERAIAWLARVSILVAGAAVAGMSDAITVPPDLETLLPAIAVVGGVTALLTATVARARTEQRTDPRGERRLRFWRGAPGRWLFRIAGVGLTQTSPIVTILGDRLETPA